MMEDWVFNKDIDHFNFIVPPSVDHSPNTPVSQNPFFQYFFPIIPTFQMGRAPNLLNNTIFYHIILVIYR